jgi:AcrR family transcriptional regulator
MARGRRSDHTREELLEIILAEGSILMGEQGYARFSARELAKRIGYSVAMVLKVTGSSDDLVTAINTRTFSRWADALEAALERDPNDRIAALVGAYFDFAEDNRNLWSAIYDHRPQGMQIPADQAEARARLTSIVVDEVSAALPPAVRGDGARLARSLIATVHGHCTYALSGSFALMGENDPRGLALSRVRDSIAVAGTR